MESHILPGFCGCPTIMVSTYYFQIHAGCIHRQNYDDVTTEDLTPHPHIAHPHPHNHHHHTVHIGTGYNHHHNHHNHHDHLGGKYSSLDRDYHNESQQQQQPHHHQQQHHQSVVGIAEDKDGSNKHHNNMGLLSFHNSTLHCEDHHGETYWVSFHEKSFYRGQHFKLYKGIINGQGRLSGIKCVVKVFANTVGTKELCNVEACKSEKFRELVQAFNRKLGKDSPHRIRATRSYWAPIDEVSKLKQLFFSGDKKLHIGEAVLFEQDVRVSDFSTKKCKMNTFVDQSGRMSSESSHGSASSYSSVVNAFVHFTHQYSNGKLVVCGLNGIKDDAGFFFSTPVVHSTDSAFGRTDRGERGIQDVLRNHTCGQLCQELLDNTDSTIPTTMTSTSIDIGDGRRGCGGSGHQEEMGGPVVCPEMNSPDCKNNNINNNTVDNIYKMATSPCSVDSVASWQNDSPDDAFLEPSAPILDGEEMEVNGNNELPPPPPYTPAVETRVALWLMREESPNAFMHPGMFLPRGSVAMGSSIECHSSHTVPAGTIPSAASMISESMSAGPGGGAFSSADGCTSITTAPTVVPAVPRRQADENVNFNCQPARYKSTNNDNNNNNNNQDNDMFKQFNTDDAINGNDNKETGISTNGYCDDNNIKDNNNAQWENSNTNNNNIGDQPSTTQTTGAEAQNPPPPPPTPTPTPNRGTPTSKQVRFAPHPSYRHRAASSSVPTTCDDITMDSCTNPTASVSSSPSLPVRFRSRHYGTSQDSANNNVNINNNNNPQNNNNINPLPANFPDDQPPPYDEHDIATARWLLDGRGGLDMYSTRPPVIIQAGQILRQASLQGIVDPQQGNDNSTVFIAISPTDINACHGRFY